ncbi:MAG: complex I subunit 4 family protein [Candidatus Dormibacteraceae bacterium]
MLTAIWLLPALAGIGCAFVRDRRAAKWLAVAAALATLALTAFVALRFDVHGHGYQFQESAPWIPQFHAHYLLGVDGISLWMIVLNAFIGLVAVLAIPARTARLGLFAGLLLLMEAGMGGLFMSTDLLLFYVFWEAMLIPAYFMIWAWGEGDRPQRAAIKFVLFTLVGSLLMLVGVVAEYAATGSRSFDLTFLATHHPPAQIQFALFFLFGLAFAIKVPIWPFHSWLPDAYMAAPTPMLVAFAGVMAKTGAYGFLRIVQPLFPHPTFWWNWTAVVPVLAVIGIIWGALLALAQRDMKALVAYSSISHMGFIVLGIFAFNAEGQQGAIVQMVNHGIIVPALFLLVAWIAARTGTRDRSALAGLAPRMPILAGIFMVVVLAALGLPGLNSFAGEFMTLLGAWQYDFVIAIVATFGLIAAPIYLLRLFQGAMYGPELTPAGEGVVDIARHELGLISPLVALMFVLGLYPLVLTRVMPALGQVMPWH